MNSKLYRSFVIPALAAVLAFGVCRTAFAQQAEVQQQEQRKSSIKKMQTRIAEIEKEMKSAATQRSQELGNEAFELFGQIDQTYLQLRNVYQQQMIQLNERVRQTWLELENAQGLARETTDKKLETLEKDWERSYQRLTESHDRHLAQLKDGLSKLRGEFSAAASQAQAELESSHFESIADWEKAHEVVLDINRAYVEIVGNQLSGLEALHQRVPDSQDIQKRLQRTNNRYLNAQKRLRSRIESHLAHLDDEFKVRERQLEAATGFEAKEEIRQSLSELNKRKHATYENLQSSYARTISALKKTSSRATAELQNKVGAGKSALEEQLADWESELVTAKDSLKKCYTAQTKSIEQQLEQMATWLPEAGEEVKTQLENRMQELKNVSATLNKKAAAIRDSLKDPDGR